MTQTSTAAFPGFPHGPNAPEVAATLRTPAIEAIDALLAQICDAEYDPVFYWNGIAERITPIPGTEFLSDETDAYLAYENEYLPSLAYAL